VVQHFVYHSVFFISSWESLCLVVTCHSL